jgi:membrane protease YdiL (CAAX protease family)
LTEDRLAGTDKRALLLWVFLGILGLLFAHKYFFRAFPEASVDFKVSRAEAQKRAKEFVEGLGENLGGYRSTIVFDVDENAKTYLERELGLQQANHLMSSELNIWYWEVRFFRPQQEEEYEVKVNPAGKIVGYDHKIEEARGGKSLPRKEALAAAQQYLQNNLGINLDNWNLLPEEANSKTRPNRLDWSFTWERKGFKAKEAPYRLEVGLQGGQIGGTGEFLQVPQAWTRDYEHLRSTNNLYEIIAIIPYGFLLGGALWLGISLTRQGKTTWGPALKVGAVVAALFMLMQLNQWNSLQPAYNTQDSYPSFLTLRIFFVLLAALGTGLTVALVLPGGEPLYHASQPDRLRLYKTFTLRGLLSKEFFCASVVGLSMAAAHIGFIVAFYMIGSKFGVWAPQDTNYSEAFNTAIPWIAGVAIGVTAATSEEFLFRLFAIPFLRKLTGLRVLAVILPAFFWGFLHSNYPQEPGYIRGLEVGLIGIVAGLVMLRWGIVATLIWHYTVDASLVGMLLIRSDNLYYKVSGIVVGFAAVAPLAWSGISYLVRGRFEPVEDLLNRAEPAPEIALTRHTLAEEAPVEGRRYEALTAGIIGFLALCLLVGGLLAWTMKREAIGDYLRLSINARAATLRADAVMKEHGLDPGTYRRAAEMIYKMDPDTNEYLRRRLPVSAINKIYSHQVPGALWRVRYFRDSQAEEFAVVLKPDGSQHGFWHALAEEAKGASLSKEEATALAEKFLQEKKQIDLKEWKLVEDKSDKRPNRIDHTLTWQQNAPLDPGTGDSGAGDAANHAFKRMELAVMGDEPADYRTYIKIPDEFVRKQGEQSLPRTLFGVGKFVLGLGLAVGAVILYFKRSRTDASVHVPWRRLFVWGLVGLAVFLLRFALGNGIPDTLMEYNTAFPWKIFIAGIALRILIFSAVIAGGLAILYGLAWHFAARAFGEKRLPTWLGMSAEYYRDAFWIALGGSVIWIGLKRLLGVASHWWPTVQHALPAHTGSSFSALYPAALILCSAFLGAFFYTGILALASSLLGAEVRVRWLRLVLFFVIAAAFIPDWGSPADFFKQFLINLIVLAFVAYGIRRIARFNVLGWFLVVTCTGLVAGAAELLGQPDSFYRMQGYLVLLALAILFGWPLTMWRLRSGKEMTT